MSHKISLKILHQHTFSEKVNPDFAAMGAVSVLPNVHLLWQKPELPADPQQEQKKKNPGTALC